jgi:hypothetical protein
MRHLPTHFVGVSPASHGKVKQRLGVGVKAGLDGCKNERSVGWGDTSMRRAIALMALIPTCALANQISDGRSFALLCVAEQSSGYSWVNNNWVPTTFKPPTYLLKKVDAASDPACKHNGKPVSTPPHIDSSDGLAFGYGTACYIWSRIGSDSLGTSCQETWARDKDAVPVLVRIVCSNFDDLDVRIFQKEVLFAESRTYAVFMDPTEKGERDTMVLQFGKCSFVS